MARGIELDDVLAANFMRLRATVEFLQSIAIRFPRMQPVDVLAAFQKRQKETEAEAERRRFARMSAQSKIVPRARPQATRARSRPA